MDFYEGIRNSYDLLNKEFFGSKLPVVVFTLNYKQSRVLGYFSPDVFSKRKMTEKRYSEISINPAHFNRDVKEILSTLLHEMCHCWEFYEGEKKRMGKGGYHTKQWAEKMKECGLDPVYNNGSHYSVSHKIIENGKFDLFYKEVKNPEEIFQIEKDSVVLTNGIGSVGKHNKITYVCACGNKVYGRKGLHIHCPDCDEDYVEQE